MRTFLALALVLPLLSTGVAFAQASPTPRPTAEAPVIDATRLICVRYPERCGRYQRAISFPANALTQSSAANFRLESRGVRWLTKAGRMEFAMRRPKDYTGQPLRVSLLFASNSAGDLQTVGFSLLPASLRDRSEYETYSGKSTNLSNVPSPGNVGDRSVVFTPGSDPNSTISTTADWWNFEITRIGDYNGPLQLMSVALEY